jgi:excisionase family DNA binding protein
MLPSVAQHGRHCDRNAAEESMTRGAHGTRIAWFLLLAALLVGLTAAPAWAGASAALPALLTLEQAAALLGIAPVTLRLWTYRGRIGFVRLGRRKLFRLDELARFVRVNTVAADKPRRAAR